MIRSLRLALLLATPVAALLVLTACETVPPLPAGTVLLAGLPVDDVKIEFGLPDDIATMADRSELWTYRHTWVAHHGNTYDSYATGSDSHDYVDKNGDHHYVNTEYFRPVFVPLTRSDESCDVMFRIGADSRVQSVEFRGNCADYKREAEDVHRAVFMPAPAKS